MKNLKTAVLLSVYFSLSSINIFADNNIVKTEKFDTARSLLQESFDPVTLKDSAEGRLCTIMVTDIVNAADQTDDSKFRNFINQYKNTLNTCLKIQEDLTKKNQMKERFEQEYGPRFGNIMNEKAETNEEFSKMIYRLAELAESVIINEIKIDEESSNEESNQPDIEEILFPKNN